MKQLLDKIDYNENIEVAKNLNGIYNKKITFHCYWNGDLNSKHLASIKSCYFFNIKNRKNRKIILWIENNNENDINNKLNKYCEVKEFILKNETSNTFLANIDVNYDFNQLTHYSDYIRMILLYKYGGCWFDLDMLFLRSLDPIFVNYENDICVTQWSTNPLPNNCFILSIKEFDEKMKEVIQFLLDRNKGFGFAQASLSYDTPINFLVLPCAWFDPIMISNPYTDINMENFFKNTNNNYTFDNFFNGAFMYHWHNQYGADIENNSIFCQLNRIINKQANIGGKKTIRNKKRKKNSKKLQYK